MQFLNLWLFTFFFVNIFWHKIIFLYSIVKTIIEHQSLNKIGEFQMTFKKKLNFGTQL